MDKILQKLKSIINVVKKSLTATGVLSTLLLLLVSCEDFVDIDPPRTELVSATVFEDDNTAIAAINGIYSEMIRSNGGLASGGTGSVSYLASLSADELNFFSNDQERINFNNNSLAPSNSINTNSLWGQTYKIIFNANAVLESLSGSNNITEPVSTQLEGEAKFIRALCYFYLVNFYGSIPIAKTTDFQTNTSASKATIDEVYVQITEDLLEAQNLLSPEYPTSERVRPNKASASTLLARVYLFNDEFEKAGNEASKVINDNNYSILPDLNEVFLANSAEAIWQLRPNENSLNTNEGLQFILASSPVTSFGGVAMTDNLVAAFESGDQRNTNWVNSFTDDVDTWFYPFKYKIQFEELVTEYSMVLRLAEQYLIRAEARARQGNVTGAQNDLNVIRNRAGLANTIASDQTALLQAIQQERRVELFTEWGHRWLDLKRTGKVDAVLSLVKNDWQSTDVLFPIPQSELEVNANLLPQNPGY